jgi:hypothetical protein
LPEFDEEPLHARPWQGYGILGVFGEDFWMGWRCAGQETRATAGLEASATSLRIGSETNASRRVESTREPRGRRQHWLRRFILAQL